MPWWQMLLAPVVAWIIYWGTGKLWDKEDRER